jgi:hypothetical protein
MDLSLDVMSHATLRLSVFLSTDRLGRCHAVFKIDLRVLAYRFTHTVLFLDEQLVELLQDH